MNIRQPICTMLFTLLFVSAAASLHGSAPDLYRKGNTALEQRNAAGYREAIVHYREALRLNPYYFEAWRNLGTAYNRLGLNAQSIEAYGNALRQQPGDLETNILYAQVLVEERRFDLALPRIQLVLSRQPRNAEALYSMALYHAATGRDDLADEQLSAALIVMPAYFRAHLLRGHIRKRAGKAAEAESSYQSAWRLAATHPEPNLALGEYYLEQANPAQARSYLERVFQNDAENQKAMQLLGRTYYYLGLWQQAERMYDGLQQEQPDDHILWYTLAEIYTRMYSESKQAQHADRAVHAFIQALRIKNNDEAIRYAFEEFIREAYPLNHAARERASAFHTERGDQMQRHNRLYEAMIAYRRALRLYPESPAARNKVAEMNLAAGQAELYLQALSIVHELDAGNIRVRDRLEYYQRRIAEIPSRKLGIKQYEVENTTPVLVVFDLFDEYNHRGDYFGMNRMLAAMLEDAFIPLHTVQIKVDAGQNAGSLVQAQQRARQLKADYFLHGRYIHTDESIVQEVQVRRADNGELLGTYRHSHRGNDRLFRNAAAMARSIAAALPMVAQIIRMDQDRVVLNFGRNQGIKAGMKFDVYPGGAFRRNYLAAYGKANSVQPVGVVEVREVDEAVSVGRVIQRRTFDTVSTYQYALLQPEAAAD